MTVAVCVKCGQMKFGALTGCPACDFVPGTDPDDDDDLYSMVLTDHYFSAEVLEQISSGMRAGAPRPKLSAEQEAEFRRSSHDASESLNKS